MKLGVKFVTLATLPITILCVVTSILCINDVSSAFEGSVQNDLYALSLVVRDNIHLGSELEDVYHVDEDGNFWNSDVLNITEEFSLYDEMKIKNDIDVTLFFNGKRVATTIRDKHGNRELGTSASSEVYSAVVGRGQEYFSDNTNVQGKSYYAQYIPLYDSTSTSPIGMVFVGRESTQVKAEINKILDNIIGTGIAILIVGVAASILIVSVMVHRIKRGVSAVEQIADGNLDINMNAKDLASKDEVGDILRAVDKLKDKLEQVVGDIHKECTSVYESVNSLSEQALSCNNHISQIDMAIEDIAKGATNQAEETEESSNNIISIGEMINSTSAETDNLMAKSNRMSDVSKDAVAILGEFKDTSDATKDAVFKAQEQMGANNKSVERINEAIQVVHQIANQTSLLALNAQIEAARAGESGKGFAVVADNIQKLAAQSNESSKEIKEITKALLTDSDEVSAAIGDIDKSIGMQTEKVSMVESTFNELISEIEQCVTSVNNIVVSIGDIDKLRVHVVESAQSLSAIAEQNAASTQETSAAVSEMTNSITHITDNSKKLEQIANELKSKISFFKVHNAG